MKIFLFLLKSPETIISLKRSQCLLILREAAAFKYDTLTEKELRSWKKDISISPYKIEKEMRKYNMNAYLRFHIAVLVSAKRDEYLMKTLLNT